MNQTGGDDGGNSEPDEQVAVGVFHDVLRVIRSNARACVPRTADLEAECRPDRLRFGYASTHRFITGGQ
jgi:hypothetical protein